MNDGSGGPLTGVKIGKAPAHRSTRTPTSTATPSTAAAPGDTSAAGSGTTTPTTTSEADVTTSDQISEHALPSNSSASNGGSNGSSFSGASRHPSPDRRTAMGIASIRIAGRLTQNELTSRDTRPMDSSNGPDELLQLLGEYLTSGGLSSPELHVRSNGTTVVLDLTNPAKGFR